MRKCHPKCCKIVQIRSKSEKPKDGNSWFRIGSRNIIETRILACTKIHYCMLQIEIYALQMLSAWAAMSRSIVCGIDIGDCDQHTSTCWCEKHVCAVWLADGRNMCALSLHVHLHYAVEVLNCPKLSRFHSRIV